MKLTKQRLKEIIKEEMLNEYTPNYMLDSDEVGDVLVDVFMELESSLKKLNRKKIEKWGGKYSKSAKKLIDIIRLLNTHITRIR